MSDLRGIDLSDENLFGLDLSWSNFAGANLSGANLGGANLSFTNFIGANLQEADLRDTCINGADLRGANLQGANLSYAFLDMANLQGANLNRARLCSTSLWCAILPDGIDYYHVKGFLYSVISTPMRVWIGCKSMPVEDWLGEKGRQAAKLHQLSKVEIERYEKILEIIRRKK